MNLPWIIPAFFLAMASPATSVVADESFTIGGNFNESLEDAELLRLKAGNTEWIRGFLPATEFIDGPRELETDERLKTFHEARESGVKIALTLKWDFKGTDTRVPTPDSPREKAYFQWALDVVEQGRPDLLLLVNEIFVDTMEDDMLQGSDGEIPMVRFLQRLTRHVSTANPTTSDGKTPLPLSCGGFTRLETAAKRSAPATKTLLPWLSESDDLAFVNFHMHGDELDDFTEALEFMRGNIPQKPFVITEFSLIWRYKKNLRDPLGSTAEGKAFAERYDLDPKMTTFDYVNACTLDQVSEKQFNEFLNSRSWYLPGFLGNAISLMRKYGVRHAFYAYHQGPPSKHIMKAGTDPWRLNPVFIDNFAISPDPDRPAANLDFAKSYLKENPPSKDKP